MKDGKIEQTDVNKGGTGTDSGTELTRECSGPVRNRLWIVRDNGDKPWGPFESAVAANAWAKKKWPDVPSYEESEGVGGFWNIEMLLAPTD